MIGRRANCVVGKIARTVSYSLQFARALVVSSYRDWGADKCLSHTISSSSAKQSPIATTLPSCASRSSEKESLSAYSDEGVLAVASVSVLLRLLQLGWCFDSDRTDLETFRMQRAMVKVMAAAASTPSDTWTREFPPKTHERKWIRHPLFMWYYTIQKALQRLAVMAAGAQYDFVVTV